MPYRDQATVQSWVKDFLRGRSEATPEISVLEQYYTEGPDSGLVVVQLRTATTVTSIQPLIEDGVATWRVRFDPREEGLDLDGEEIERLADDLSLLAELCRYLQSRTREDS